MHGKLNRRAASGLAVWLWAAASGASAADMALAQTPEDVARVVEMIAAHPERAVLATSRSGEPMTCIPTAEVCVEAGGTRYIDGVAVTRDCWGTRETFACITAVDGDAENGCRTLEADRAAGESNVSGEGPGGCRMQSRTCSESVTATDGTDTCLAEKEEWSCKTQIELPPVNAQWTGTTEGSEESRDESACEPYFERSDCVKGELACTDAGCTRTYLCGGKSVSGCTTLIESGCSVVQEPACDLELDAMCAIKKGVVKCVGDLPDGVIDAGGGEIDDETTVNVGSPKPDASACAALQGPGIVCRQVSQKCVDDYPPTRVINGKVYRLPCWGYERVMECVNTNPESSCTGLEETPGCRVLQAKCVEEGLLDKDGDGAAETPGCLKEVFTYACGSAGEVDAGDAELIESSSSITGTVEVDTCRELAENDVCRLQEAVCTEEGGTKIINGVPVAKDCWAWEKTYVCGSGAGGSGEVINDCGRLEADPDCRLTHTECFGTDASGACNMMTHTFVCGGGTEEVVTGEVCDGALCIAGVCEGAPGEASEDFLEGVAILEIIRQAGVYGDAKADSIFGGTPSGCSVKAAGFSCCRSDVAQTSGSLSNSAFGVALQVGIDAGMELIKWVGSPYVYDLLSSHEATSGILTALYGDAASGVYTPSFSYYGVSASITSSGSLTLEFSPMGFMAAVALEMAADYFSCTEEDRLHALRSDRGLCHYVGSFCDKTSAAGCLEKKESWVCFNSRLARIVQEQARRQLGLGWGTPRAPLARGLTLEEFQALDFSEMDLSGIVAEVARQAAQGGYTVNPDAVKVRAGLRVAQAAASGDQYTEVDTVTGKQFAGETHAPAPGVRAIGAWLLKDYAKPLEGGVAGSRVLREAD